MNMWFHFFLGGGLRWTKCWINMDYSVSFDGDFLSKTLISLKSVELKRLMLICVSVVNWWILCLAGGEIWWAESRCVELWGHPVCSIGGKSFTPVFTTRVSATLNFPPSFCQAYFRHVRFPLLSPTGCPAFWPWQFTPAPGEGEERSVPHATLHPAGLSVSAQGHDWGQPWKEAHGTRLCSYSAGFDGNFILGINTYGDCIQRFIPALNCSPLLPFCWNAFAHCS